ncbi:hypothetical protein WX45_00167 [Clostridium ljungdahlii DSM 13528]|uniref:Uncharacterized protein n=2 Tax=Clostridium TaxID=1485 RepID=A0A166SXA5_9CLOT|nr:Hypothetical protein CLAU_3719 [Clostridium autoethanogenum DSM 10061]OAA85962.1 hypothetical protein WX45_00167 [Clostridium ljungdahlii DSM 13528]OAA92898.1 hypothetical protein WX73_00567 [Clostridium coskatii]OBR95840.1 hypothetical protein CLCOS_12730 [Clostridium coskatii]OVY50910.1 hypothetical protein WX72_02071 [Clostridium autoethanogenum]
MLNINNLNNNYDYINKAITDKDTNYMNEVQAIKVMDYL